MKRISVAELTLKKQIERITRDMETCQRERKAYDLQYDILLRQHDALKDEFDRLAAARRKSSEQRKPANDTTGYAPK
jgi:hypothetical protein